MAGRLEGKVVFITGAGSVGPGWGNGRATAVRFAQATSALNASGLGSQAGVESFEHTLNFMKTTQVKN